jgi:hypothetical protein
LRQTMEKFLQQDMHTNMDVASTRHEITSLMNQ